MGNLNLELTRREKEVLEQASLGQTNAEIARELNISAVTVKDHLSSIFWKLRVSNRTQAVVAAHHLREAQRQTPV